MPLESYDYVRMLQVSSSTMADKSNDESLLYEYDDYCCADNRTVWLRFETWMWAIFLVVQMSMVVFLVVHGRKDKSFREAFYVFFVVVTVVDCVLVLWVRCERY